MSGKIFAGTSGYSYKEWVGAFYPETLKADEWLSFYASQLPSVEINNTFYRMPKAHVVEGWRDAVPDHFRFVIKASRRITHQSRLKDCDEALDYLQRRVRLLHEKLGCVLFQLPPFLRADRSRLEAFLSQWPEDLPAALEFRHESWGDPDIDTVLKAHGATRVLTHGEDSSNGAGASTTKDLGPKDLGDFAFIYLRLRAPAYTLASLRKWYDAISKSERESAFVYFKHEDAGAGPALASRFMDLRGAPSAAKGPKAAPRKRAATRKKKETPSKRG